MLARLAFFIRIKVELLLAKRKGKSGSNSESNLQNF